MRTDKLFKFNVIFTGKFLIIWYIAFAVIVLIMIGNFWRLRSVSEYYLTIYDMKGNIVTNEQVSKEEVGLLLMQLPVTKSFKPIK